MRHDLLLQLLLGFLFVALVGVAEDACLVRVFTLLTVRIDISVPTSVQETETTNNVKILCTSLITKRAILYTPCDTVDTDCLLLEGSVVVLESPGNGPILVLFAVLAKDLCNGFLLTLVVMVVVTRCGPHVIPRPLLRLVLLLGTVGLGSGSLHFLWGGLSIVAGHLDRNCGRALLWLES